MSFAARMFRINAGIVIWALHFTAIYAFTALACARGLPQSAVAWVVGIASLAAAGACIYVGVAGLRSAAHFESWISAGLAGLALIAITWETLPVLTVPICA